ncbi:MAG: histidinol dehydrogenase [Candidatus Schekmanbacteria bacterium]|nr:histidinol dehydrogenase [Candidatus Schekmanbacteria bacterium]
MKILNTNQQDFKAQFTPILSRGQADFSLVEKQVKKIISQVRQKKDAALVKYTRRFDRLPVKSAADLTVQAAEIQAAYSQLTAQQIEAIKLAAERIRNYHLRQMRQSWFMEGEDGIRLGQLIRPLERAGVYVPGGKAAYPSSVLMNVIPAQVAGVKEIILCSPVNPNGKLHPAVLAAADILGVSRIFRIGGAQAVAAMTYGTETVPRVDKIVGPGNTYVAAAKRLVYGEVGIDMVAGPSEILVIADESASADYVAADLLSQAEHDELACSILLTPSVELAQAVFAKVPQQLRELSRNKIAAESIARYGLIVVTRDLDEAAELADWVAPEHLELAVKNPQALLEKIHNAGAIFLGHYTPEPIGDYLAGPNHVLPTGGSARFSSPLGVDDFIKKSSLISYSASAMTRQAATAIQLAEMEGLTAHAAAVRQRLEL